LGTASSIRPYLAWRAKPVSPECTRPTTHNETIVPTFVQRRLSLLSIEVQPKVLCRLSQARSSSHRLVHGAARVLDAFAVEPFGDGEEL
jgi:hypothetical protein